MSVNYYLIQPRPGHTDPPQIRLPCGREITAEIVWPDEDDPRIHVALFAGRVWSWAQPPAEIWAMCAEYRDVEIIRAEHGVCYTGAAFLALRESGEQDDVSSVGTRFS
mgnify:FL=1